MRIDDGALLDGGEQITRARAQLTAADRRQLAGILDCPCEKLDGELDALAARARTGARKLRVDGALRERARSGRYAYVHERGADFAASIWVVDPASRTARSAPTHAPARPRRRARTSASATTFAPAWSSRPRPSCRRSRRSSATCSPATSVS